MLGSLEVELKTTLLNILKFNNIVFSSSDSVCSPPDQQKIYVATCIYKPGAADELEVTPGDELLHVNRDPNGWVKVKNKVTGCQGWVPMACLRQVSS